MATVVQTVHQKKRFLEAFAKCGNVSAAARLARIRRPNVYDWLANDPDFAEAYREAEVVAKEAVEAEIRRRGVDGWNEPVYQGGVKVGAVRKFSDTLLIFLAKKLMPEYRDSIALDHKGKVKHEHSGRIDLRQATDDELAVLERLAERAGLN